LAQEIHPGAVVKAANKTPMLSHDREHGANGRDARCRFMLGILVMGLVPAMIQVLLGSVFMGRVPNLTVMPPFLDSATRKALVKETEKREARKTLDFPNMPRMRPAQTAAFVSSVLSVLQFGTALFFKGGLPILPKPLR
jgi:hypothetical protein